MKVKELIDILNKFYKNLGNVDCYIYSEENEENTSTDINYVTETYAWQDKNDVDITIMHLKSKE